MKEALLPTDLLSKNTEVLQAEKLYQIVTWVYMKSFDEDDYVIIEGSINTYFLNWSERYLHKIMQLKCWPCTI